MPEVGRMGLNLLGHWTPEKSHMTVKMTLAARPLACEKRDASSGRTDYDFKEMRRNCEIKKSNARRHTTFGS